MKVTVRDVKRLAPRADNAVAEGIEKHAGLLARYNIDTPLRVAHFMAQLAHESAGFRTTREYHDGSNYEGRRDLGNTEPGDGKRFRGRGLIQLTGRANYREAGGALGRNLVGHPEHVEQFPLALEVSCWFWQARDINDAADQDDVVAVTRRINGGTNGLNDRKRYLRIAKQIYIGEVFRKGDAGPEVERIQKIVGAKPVDGVFGPITDQAVREWQIDHGLTPDGVVGPDTWAAMDRQETDRGVWVMIVEWLVSILKGVRNAFGR